MNRQQATAREAGDRRAAEGDMARLAVAVTPDPLMEVQSRWLAANVMADIVRAEGRRMNSTERREYFGARDAVKAARRPAPTEGA